MTRQPLDHYLYLTCSYEEAAYRIRVEQIMRDSAEIAAPSFHAVCKSVIDGNCEAFNSEHAIPCHAMPC